LADDAVLRAKQLLAYQKKREHFGLIEAADRLQAEALLASRQMQYSNAQATLNSSYNKLNRLMLRDTAKPINISIDTFTPTSMQQNMPELLQQAENNRPIFHMLDAQQAANDAQLAIARDQYNTQVDLVGQIGSRALSASAGTAFQQGFTLNDRFISLGVEVSDTLGSKSARSSIQKAELERERIELQRLQARESIKTALSNALTDYKNAKNTKKSAIHRKYAEKLKFNAEMQRYKQGRSDTATLVQFEGDLRTAELQAALQDIQLQLALTQINFATGKLLQAFYQEVQSQP